jgi:hypothetical protein
MIVGSQALLVHHGDVLKVLRNSPEIDAAVLITSSSGPLGEDASHQINALFGEGSPFHQTHGFFIDGVDQSTAILPTDWRERAIVRSVDIGNGRTADAVAPAIPDLVSAKLARGLPKDVTFASLCLATGLTRRKAIADSIAKAMEPDMAESALRLLDRAVANQQDEMVAARRGTGVLSKGPSSNPLNDADAYEAVRRALTNRGSER